MCYLYPTRTFSMGVLFAFSNLPFSYSTHNSYDRREIFRSPSLPPSLLPFLPAWQPIGQLFPAGRIGYSPPLSYKLAKACSACTRQWKQKGSRKQKKENCMCSTPSARPSVYPLGTPQTEGRAVTRNRNLPSRHLLLFEGGRRNAGASVRD